MIDREQVKNDFFTANVNIIQQIYLYILLDIRDLLIDIKKQGEDK